MCGACLCFALVTVTDINFLIDMQQMPLPPSIYQRLTSSSTLLNLAQALAYHKMYVPFFNFNLAGNQFYHFILKNLLSCCSMLILENYIGSNLVVLVSRKHTSFGHVFWVSMYMSFLT